MKKSLFLIGALLFLASCGLGGGGTVLDGFVNNYWQMRQGNEVLEGLNASIRQGLDKRLNNASEADSDSAAQIRLRELFDAREFIEDVLNYTTNKLEKLAGLDIPGHSIREKDASSAVASFWKNDELDALRAAFLLYEKDLAEIAAAMEVEPLEVMWKREEFWDYLAQEGPIVSHLCQMEGLKSALINAENYYLMKLQEQQELPAAIWLSPLQRLYHYGMEITSKNSLVMYRDCGNDVEINVPAWEENYSPIVEVDKNSSVRQGKANPRSFLVVPKGKKCEITVNAQVGKELMKIGQAKYRVVSPPKPKIEMLVNGKVYNGSSPIPKTSRLLVRIVPDPEFRQFMPNDARYGITKISVLGQLSLGPPKNVGLIEGGRAEKGIKVSMPSPVRKARPGTKVYVRLEEIYRVNYRSKKIPETRFSEIERTLGLVTR